MNIFEFELKIKDKSLNKGLRLFLNNTEEVVSDNNTHSIVIIDDNFNLFDVSVILDENFEIIETRCSCGKNLLCPHKIAGFYSIREHIVKITNNEYFNDLINENIEKLDKSKIIKIVKEITNDDYLLKAKLILKTLPKRSEDYFKIIDIIFSSEGSNIEYIIDFNNYIYKVIKGLESLELVKFILTYVLYGNKYSKTYYKRVYDGYYDVDLSDNEEEVLMLLNLERYIYLLNKYIVLIDEETDLTIFINDLASEYYKEIDLSSRLISLLFIDVLKFTSYKSLSEFENYIKKLKRIK